MQVVLQAFQRLSATPKADDAWARCAARTVLEVTLVLLGFSSVSFLVSHLQFEGVTARTVVAIVMGSAYAALYTAVVLRHSGMPKAWSSVALLVLELAMLAILLPFLVGLSHLVVPKEFLDMFVGTT